MKRDDLQRQIRKIITGCEGCGPEDPCIYCMAAGAALAQAVKDVMELIDRHVDDVLTDLDSEELWTAAQVAEYAGLSSTHAARARLSVAKIRCVKTVTHPETRRSVAMYSAAQVRIKLPAKKRATR